MNFSALHWLINELQLIERCLWYGMSECWKKAFLIVIVCIFSSLQFQLNFTSAIHQHWRSMRKALMTGHHWFERVCIADKSSVIKPMHLYECDLLAQWNWYDFWVFAEWCRCGHSQAPDRKQFTKDWVLALFFRPSHNKNDKWTSHICSTDKSNKV